MRGVALVETLVAILIFSVGVLGLVGMQAAMTRAQGAGKFRADAANLANEVIGLMWVDRPQSIGVLSSNLTKYTTANCDTYDPCSDWKAKVGSLLPLGTTAITADETSGAVTITLTWTIANEGLHSYATSTNVFIK
jgi:type IV pilus assembly protein PilV